MFQKCRVAFFLEQFIDSSIFSTFFRQQKKCREKKNFSREKFFEIFFIFLENFFVEKKKFSRENFCRIFFQFFREIFCREKKIFSRKFLSRFFSFFSRKSNFSREIFPKTCGALLAYLLYTLN